ncbi:MAG: hypothetical protein UT15_C0003G0031 [Berkelbacteria bacterium GW2011_GWA1_39_10]|uniref:Uncharacterized protein n=1 Tax=Berkelbacteria bacterium GW2011_GWA1_39_10 TaxID=1618332 RepID=A0A0G0PNF9_9BACT|nr:MAG: hypothetical protein UT15_C0003G0031 [Berkelbacteria bacterium GW2011_GWA1_39_10]
MRTDAWRAFVFVTLLVTVIALTLKMPLSALGMFLIAEFVTIAELRKFREFSHVTGVVLGTSVTATALAIATGIFRGLNELLLSVLGLWSAWVVLYINNR